MNISYLFIISNDSVTFSSIENNMFNLGDTFLFSSINIELQKEELNTFINNLNLDFQQCNQVLISYYTGNNMLLPSSAFEVNNIAKYFNYCFDELNVNNELDFNRIYTLSIVNIFSIPKWLKKFWILRYPKVQIKHYSTIQIHGLTSSAKYEKEIHLSFFEKEIHIIFFNKKTLVFHNSFTFETVDDIIYYLSFCIQQESWSEENNLNIFYYIFNKSLFDTFEAVKNKSMAFKVFHSASWLDNSQNHLKFIQNCAL